MKGLVFKDEGEWVEYQEKSIREFLSVVSDVPQTESEFVDMVYRCKFEELAELFQRGQLKKFEAHSFMERVVQHALLRVSVPEIAVEAACEGRSFWISIDAVWPNNPIINVARWRIVSSRGPVKDGVIERRASSSRISERIQIKATSRADVQVVFGVRAPSGTIASSDDTQRQRVIFNVGDELEDDFDVINFEDFEIERYRYVPKSPVYPRLVSSAGFAIIVVVVIWQLMQWF